MKKLKSVSVFIIIITLSSGCVQKQHMKTVTFKVDLRAVETLGDVGVKGEFTNPQWGQIIELSDEDRDGIYEVTLNQETAQNIAEFKFVNNGVYELKGQSNRQLTMEFKPETIVYSAVFNEPNGNQIIK